MSRVIVLVLDAAEPGYVDRLVNAGDLPNLARLRERSLQVPLRSEAPYRSEFPLPEFTAGRRSQSIRYWSTVTFDPATYDCYMRGSAPVDPFYALGEGTKVVAFDVPKVVPSRELDGVQILGWGAHSPQHPLFSAPDGLLGEIEDRFGPHPAMPIEYSGSWNMPDYLEELGRAQAAGARRRADALRWLADQQSDWDLLVTCFAETHQTGHVMWHGVCDDSLLSGAPSRLAAREAYRGIHRAVDEALGAVLDWAPVDAAVVVVSTQGLAAGDEDAVVTALLPELLYRWGTGGQRRSPGDLGAWRLAGAAPIVPPASVKPDDLLQHEFRGVPGRPRPERARDRVHHALARHAPGVLRARRRVLDAVRARARGPRSTGVEPEMTFPLHDESMNVWHPATWYRDAWPSMPAFVINSFSDAHIRINLAGRERDGVVALEDYQRVCDEVERVLRASRNARDGRAIVTDVFRMRADDPFDPDGPTADLVVRVDGTDAIEHPELGSVGPVVIPRSGAHSQFGFADIAGPGIVPGVASEHRPCDISATVCALLGREPLVPLDGRSVVDPVGIR